MLAEDDPNFNEMRAIQEVVVRYRAGWDMSYILSTLIEERYLEQHPGDTVVRDRLIMAYQNAIRYGNRLPEVWQRLIEHLNDAGRAEDARTVLRDAALRGVAVESGRGQLPQPYGRMYADVQESPCI
jgi:hypothetical protein